MLIIIRKKVYRHYKQHNLQRYFASLSHVKNSKYFRVFLVFPEIKCIFIRS